MLFRSARLTGVAFVISLLTMSVPVMAQAFLPEDNLAYPVQVTMTGGGGSGFFVRRDRTLFFVTAGHVLFEQQRWEPHAGEATLRALSKDPRETAVTVIHANVSQFLEAKEIHLDRVRDVAVARLGTFTRDVLATTPGVIVTDRKSTRLNSSHTDISRMPSSA